MRLRQVVLFALLPLAVVGCTDSTGRSDAAEPAATSAASAVGSWGEPDERGRPSLLLAADGGLTGSDGCNRLMGSWTADGTTVTFSPLASTMMFCEGVDTWLLGAASAELTGDTLVVRDAAGAEIGTLERAAD